MSILTLGLAFGADICRCVSIATSCPASASRSHRGASYSAEWRATTGALDSAYQRTQESTRQSTSPPAESTAAERALPFRPLQRTTPTAVGHQGEGYTLCRYRQLPHVAGAGWVWAMLQLQESFRYCTNWWWYHNVCLTVCCLHDIGWQESGTLFCVLALGPDIAWMRVEGWAEDR